MKTINYTRDDIIRRSGDQLNLNNNEMKLILDIVLNTITSMLIEKRSRTRIELRNFGVFEVKPTKAKHHARNPKTNKEVYVPPRRKIQFKAGKLLRDELKIEWKE